MQISSVKWSCRCNVCFTPSDMLTYVSLSLFLGFFFPSVFSSNAPPEFFLFWAVFSVRALNLKNDDYRSVFTIYTKATSRAKVVSVYNEKVTMDVKCLPVGSRFRACMTTSSKNKRSQISLVNVTNCIQLSRYNKHSFRPIPSMCPALQLVSLQWFRLKMFVCFPSLIVIRTQLCS